jgi:hypothetical protein
VYDSIYDTLTGRIVYPKTFAKDIKFITLIRPVIDVPVHLFVSFADDVVQRFYLIEIKEGLADASESAIFILPEQLI